MSSLSSSSVGSSSSLGNTSLRGFGGMASGIDRDAIIEQMTLGTNTKITNQEKEITKLEWKQEIYRGISDQILDLYDNYSSYMSSSNLKDPSFFAKNIVSTHGKDDSTRFVTASGSSELISSVSLQAVKQLATSSVLQSKERTDGKLQTAIKDLNETAMWQSHLVGKQIRFATDNGKDGFSNQITWELPTTVQRRDASGKVVLDADGKEIMEEIDYFPEDAKGYKKLAEQLTNAYKDFADKNGMKTDALEFKYNESTEKIELAGTGNFDDKGRQIMAHSNALSALGYTGSKDVKTITIADINKDMGNKFAESAVTQTNTVDYLTGKKVTFNYDGSQKEVELITEADKKTLSDMELTDAEKQEVADALAGTNGSTLKDDLTEKIKNELKFELYNDLVNTALEQVQKDNPSLTGEELQKAVQERYYKNVLGSDYSESLTGEELEEKLQNKLNEMVDNKYPSADIEKKVEERAYSDKLNNKKLDHLKTSLQNRLDKAFGKGNVVVDNGDKGLTFSTKKDSSSVSISTNDYTLLFNLGIANGESNKVNTSGKLSQSALGIDINSDDYKDGLVINGVTIGGIDANTSISSILSKINSSDAGVKATYVSATGQFMLVSNETGAGRDITLDSNLAKELFGNGKDSKDDLNIEYGKDAIIQVSYGNGVTVEMERASNTFNLEGMTVTVSGVFGGEYEKVSEDEADKDENGNVIKDKNGNYLKWKEDTSAAVTFSAKADVDKAVEKVKKFFEDFNKLVTEVNTQVTSRPDSSYGPLTDEQKDEMDEKSIENWEKKAKTGLLYNDSTMRQLSMDVQSILTNFLNTNGFNYQDLEKMGITYSDNYKDGGTLVFDEAKFRSAMESDPESVSNVFAGGNKVKKGLMQVVEDTFTPYATRFASRNGSGKGSYGRLIEEAGSEKIPTSLLKNQIYNEIKSKQELIEQLRDKLKKEQDRYISQFSTMETLISQMNSQSSWLSQITG